MEDDNHGHFRFWIGDVGGDSFAEVPGNAGGFWPYSFYGNDPNCLAGFNDEMENGEVVVSLYKSCIGDAEPTLVETAVLPISRPVSRYLLSPEGDKWAAYTMGNSTLDEQAVLHVHKIGDSNPPQPVFQKQTPTCTNSMHWQDNETLEFLYAECDNTRDRMTYFYVIDWEGKVLTTRYELPALQEPPSESSISTNYYTPESGDWFADNNLFVFSISRGGSPTPAFNGLYVLNLTTGETEQILSNSEFLLFTPGYQPPQVSRNKLCSRKTVYFCFYVVFIINLVFIATFTLLQRAAAQPQNTGFLYPPYFDSATVTPALAWSSAVAVAASQSRRAALQTVPHAPAAAPHLACQSPAIFAEKRPFGIARALG